MGGTVWTVHPGDDYREDCHDWTHTV